MIQEPFVRLMEQFDISHRTLEDEEVSLVVVRLPQDEPAEAQDPLARR